jgi:hypothetical protein
MHGECGDDAPTDAYLWRLRRSVVYGFADGSVCKNGGDAVRGSGPHDLECHLDELSECHLDELSPCSPVRPRARGHPRPGRL